MVIAFLDSRNIKFLENVGTAKPDTLWPMASKDSYTPKKSPWDDSV